ncbi:MAG: alkaline phosphatase family protein [Myxococcales bacterium]|nr:alkaline phosphatase family protein [Myxococcales bacterium]
MKRTHARWLAVAVCASGYSCAHAPVQPRDSNAKTIAADDRPRLVVVMVVDQLGSWILERYLPYLSPQGAFRTGMASGAYHQTVSYLHASTFTAPGHAATYSGASPAKSGICANVTWDRATQKRVRVVDKGKRAWLSDPNFFASPEALRVSSVADVLSTSTQGASQIVSLAYKDYAAVLAGGRNPSLVLWYAPNGQPPGFTTSTYYAERLPDWLVIWQAHHRPEDYMEIWHPIDEELLQRINGNDAGAGEIECSGLGTLFPHDPQATVSPALAFEGTPAANEYLFDLAWESIERLDLGKDKVPDLLMISVSSPDVIGHCYGTESWEYLDNLMRLDTLIAAFVTKVSISIPTAFVLTSDHGAAPMPEKRMRKHLPAGRIQTDALATIIQRAIENVMGEGQWVAHIEPPFVYLANSIHQGPRRERAVKAVLDTLSHVPGIEAALDISDVANWRNIASTLRYPVGLSVSDNLDADVYVLPSQYYIFDNDNKNGGTNHGTLWPYDRDVPFIMWGTGITHAESRERMDHRRVSSTIAALLQIPPPQRMPLAPLEGVSSLLIAR